MTIKMADQKKAHSPTEITKPGETPSYFKVVPWYWWPWDLVRTLLGLSLFTPLGFVVGFYYGFKGGFRLAWESLKFGATASSQDSKEVLTGIKHAIRHGRF